MVNLQLNYPPGTPFTKKVTDYFLVFSAFGFGIYFLFQESKEVYLLYTILLGVSLLLKGRLKFDRTLVMIFFYLFTVALIQSLMFAAGRVTTILFSITMLVVFPYFILELVGLKFIKIYINIITFFAVISLIFWALSNYSPGFHEWTYNLAGKIKSPLPDLRNEQFFIYTYEKAETSNFIRNPGPTHEPGNWAVYLIFSLLLSLIINRKLFTISKLIIISTILTTFSSAGYLGLFIIIGYHFGLSKTDRIIKIIIFPVALFLLFYFYINLDFMQEKINTRINEELLVDASQGSGRIVGAKRAINVMLNYPLTGRGFLSATKADLSKNPEQYADYGILTLGAQIGIIGLVFYIFFLIKAFKNLNLITASQPGLFLIFALLSLFIQLFSQSSYSTPVFVMLFLSSPLLEKLKIIRINQLKEAF